METLGVSEFGSLFELIMSSPQDASEWSTDQLNDYFSKLRHCGQETYEKLKILTDEFNALRERNLDLDDKVQKLHENLDQQRAAMRQGDVNTYEEVCRREYIAFWDDLDNDSQEFLITAHFLYNRCEGQNTDFAPVIIEFCRVFENELLKKIFSNFIQRQAGFRHTPSYQNSIFSKITKAVDKQRSSGYFFLSSMDMVELLELMNQYFNTYSYEWKLKKHILDNGFDTTKLSDSEHFISPAKDYVKHYRNRAAHPRYLYSHHAEECKNKTNDLVGQFISAKTSIIHYN